MNTNLEYVASDNYGFTKLISEEEIAKYEEKGCFIHEIIEAKNGVYEVNQGYFVDSFGELIFTVGR